MADSYEQDRKLHDDIKDFLAKRLPGTRFGPHQGDAHVLTDVVVITGWVDGNGRESFGWTGTGHTWANEGLLRQALDDLVGLRETDEDEAG